MPKYCTSMMMSVRKHIVPAPRTAFVFVCVQPWIQTLQVNWSSFVESKADIFKAFKLSCDIHSCFSLLLLYLVYSALSSRAIMFITTVVIFAGIPHLDKPFLCNSASDGAPGARVWALTAVKVHTEWQEMALKNNLVLLKCQLWICRCNKVETSDTTTEKQWHVKPYGKSKENFNL